MIKKELARFCTPVFFILTTVSLQAQMKPQEEFDYYKAKYPKESAIYIKKQEIVDYSIVNDSVHTVINVFIEMMQLNDNAQRHSSESVYSSSFSQVSDLKAYTLIPKKRKYEKVEVIDFKESFDKNSNVFYDDTKHITFTYPAMRKGVKTILEYKRFIKNPKLMSIFFFDSHIPIEKAVYQIDYDNGISLNPFFFNPSSVKINLIQDSPDSPKERSRYLLEAIEVDKIKFDTRSPSYNYLAASVYVPIANFMKSNGTEEDVITTTESLHEWYRSFIKDLHHNSDEIKSLVHSLIKPDDPVLDKVRKIYYWVQANIKYIAFEDGMRGLIPHPANYVVQKRYGDCKDMSSILVSMMREAGLDAQYTWVGSRALPYSYSKVPSPITDNHMIATFSHNDSTYYLDATGQYTPLDLPTSMIQGKECLISYNDDNFKIHTIPVISKEKNVMSDSVKIILEDGIIKGHGTVKFTGYAKVFNNYSLIKASEKNVDDYLDRLLNKGNNKFQINKYEISNLDSFDSPTSISYDFTVSDYYRQVGNDIYINPILDKTMTDSFIENREVSFENEYKYKSRSIVNLQVPEGFRINNIPENTSNRDANFGYSITYSVSETEIVIKKEFFEDFLILEPSDFKSWNAIISEYAKACRNSIILTKNEIEN